MRRMFYLFTCIFFVQFFVSCRGGVWSTRKELSPIEGPVVYALSIKLMDENWIDQELGRIPLLIEETRDGKNIMRVRVLPSGDIKLPGITRDDIVFRWKLESCDVSRIDDSYTITLVLEYVKLPGNVTQTLHKGDVSTCIYYGDVPAGEVDARMLVHRAADGSFSVVLKNDNISCIADLDARAFIKDPGFVQQSLDLKLVLPCAD